jgi:formylglycine-generating enzyme required for sulfatase activity
VSAISKLWCGVRTLSIVVCCVGLTACSSPEKPRAAPLRDAAVSSEADAAQVDASVSDAGTLRDSGMPAAVGGAGRAAAGAGAGGCSAGACAGRGGAGQAAAAGSGGGGASGGPPSCSGLAASCGPNADEDCCSSLRVPGGSFWRGARATDPDGAVCAGMFMCGADEMPGGMATVRAFRLDRFEITVGRFRKYVEAKHYKPNAGAGKHGYLAAEPGWDASWLQPSTPADWDKELTACNYGTWTASVGANESKALNCLAWSDAYAFCIWDGGFLPTETEWEFAASGGEERPFPWGTGVDSSRACYSGCSGGVQAVGSKPHGDGKWGHADLAGNVWEWVLDFYGPYTPNCEDCANFDRNTDGRHIARGGEATEFADRLRTTLRHKLTGAISGPYGARCARADE